MGLIQNIASLAQPTANTIRPTDILTAGQQGQQQIQAGLAGAANMMANERKQTAQDRADQAVAGLLSKAPSGTQDPTQFNQALGLVSSYGSQGMKDAARNAITSATEGYRTGLQQENFGKTFELDQSRFGLEKDKFSFDKEFKIKELDLKKEQIANEKAYQNGTISIGQYNATTSRINALSQKNQADFNNKLNVFKLGNEGITYNDTTKNFKYDPNSVNALGTYSGTLLGEWDKKYGGSNVIKSAKEIGSINSGWNPFGNLWATEKGQQQEVISRADQVKQLLPTMISEVIGQKGTTKRTIDGLFGSAESFLRTGKIDSNSLLAKKLNLSK